MYDAWFLETRPDWSTGRILGMDPVFEQLSSIYVIEELSNPRRSQYEFTFQGNAQRVMINETGSPTSPLSFDHREGPATSILLRGDTGGDDISGDFDCSDDTKIERIEFKSQKLQITRYPDTWRIDQTAPAIDKLKPKFVLTLSRDGQSHRVSDSHAALQNYKRFVSPLVDYTFRLDVYDKHGLSEIDLKATSIDPINMLITRRDTGWDRLAGNQTDPSITWETPDGRRVGKVSLSGTIKIRSGSSIEIEARDLSGNVSRIRFGLSTQPAATLFDYTASYTLPSP